MEQKQIGLKLLELSSLGGGNSTKVIEQWGGTENFAAPSIIVLPNGNHLVGYDTNVEYEGFMIVPWMVPVDQPLPDPIKDISDRQFFQAAANQGIITKEEALNAVKTGSIPATLQSIIDSIEDEDEKFAAEMLLSGATTFSRYHSLVNQIGSALNKTEEEIDQFFINASSL